MASKYEFVQQQRVQFRRLLLRQSSRAYELIEKSVGELCQQGELTLAQDLAMSMLGCWEQSQMEETPERMGLLVPSSSLLKLLASHYFEISSTISKERIG